MVRIHRYVEAFADGLGVSMRGMEAKHDSKGFGMSNDGCDMNSDGEDCGRKRDQELSFGPMRREVPIRHPSGGAEWAVECMSLEFRRQSGLERHISESPAGTYIWYTKPQAWVILGWHANIQNKPVKRTEKNQLGRLCPFCILLAQVSEQEGTLEIPAF